MPKYMLLMNYGLPDDLDVPPIEQWSADDIAAHHRFQKDLGKELTEAGELLGGLGLDQPEKAKIVRWKGSGAPAVTDGPFPESKEFLAGYWLLECSAERAVEIAAKASAAPGPGGVPMDIPIEVRQAFDEPPEA